MRYRQVSVSIGVLVSLLVIINSVNALSAVTINSVTPSIPFNCTTNSTVIVDADFTPDTDDGGGNDIFTIVVLDASGNVISGININQPVGAPQNVNVPTAINLSAPTARPFTVRVYDTTALATLPAEYISGPIMASVGFDPSPFHVDCAALPLLTNTTTSSTSSGPVIDPASIPTDDRINFGFGDKSEGIVYGRSSIGIQVYEVRADSSGYLAVNVPLEDLPACDPAPTENQLLASSADGQFSIWLLTTCEYQVNMGPDADGKVHVVIWRGVPAIKESIVFSDFNVFDILDG